MVLHSTTLCIHSAHRPFSDKNRSGNNNYKWPLGTVVKNIRKAEVMYAEIPNTYYSVPEGQNTIRFEYRLEEQALTGASSNNSPVYVGSTMTPLTVKTEAFEFQIPAGQYEDTTSLYAAINPLSSTDLRGIQSCTLTPTFRAGGTNGFHNDEFEPNTLTTFARAQSQVLLPQTQEILTSASTAFDSTIELANSIGFTMHNGHLGVRNKINSSHQKGASQQNMQHIDAAGNYYPGETVSKKGFFTFRAANNPRWLGLASDIVLEQHSTRFCAGSTDTYDNQPNYLLFPGVVEIGPHPVIYLCIPELKARAYGSEGDVRFGNNEATEFATRNVLGRFQVTAGLNYYNYYDDVMRMQVSSYECNPPVHVSELTIQFLDDMGHLINFNGGHHSLMIKLTFDE